MKWGFMKKLTRFWDSANGFRYFWGNGFNMLNPGQIFMDDDTKKFSLTNSINYVAFNF
jgi:hypothetical protein